MVAETCEYSDKELPLSRRDQEPWLCCRFVTALRYAVKTLSQSVLLLPAS
ncbi:hypothetical protein PUN28_007624 [Cardiocondyla obscurior]|uniref:Uncharacterized protein n=1 Tax=Cardiocondyla obscurior TaxID=286306 RepID=A0AAW2G7C6_9HYME